MGGTWHEGGIEYECLGVSYVKRATLIPGDEEDTLVGFYLPVDDMCIGDLRGKSASELESECFMASMESIGNKILNLHGGRVTRSEAIKMRDREALGDDKMNVSVFSIPFRILASLFLCFLWICE